MNVMMPMEPWTIDMTPPTQRAPRAERGQMTEVLSPALLSSFALWLAETVQNDHKRDDGDASEAPPSSPKTVDVLGSVVKLRRRGERSGAARSGTTADERGPSIESVLTSFLRS